MPRDSNVTDNQMIEIARTLKSIDGSLKRIADLAEWAKAKAEALELQQKRRELEERHSGRKKGD